MPNQTITVEASPIGSLSAYDWRQQGWVLLVTVLSSVVAVTYDWLQGQDFGLNTALVITIGSTILTTLKRLLTDYTAQSQPE